MPALFVFLLKVNIALIVFCMGYYLVLRKLTFYTLNRVYLGLGIIFSSIYPLINLTNFLQRHQQIAKPMQQVVINWKAPAEQFIQQPGYWQWATIIFWLGATVFAVRLLVQLFSLYKLYRNSQPATIQDHDVRITTANISPFSFWQNIYINPDNLDTADLKSILQHEQVHVKEWHTLDILLAEISLVFYWFNPGVWLMKKAVRENIEFITDRKILQAGMDTKAYQYSLLNVSIAATTSAGITNHFNFSTLKKRIKMMNAKRSSNVNLTRYAVLIPMVTVLLLIFSFSKAELIKNNRNQLTHLITATINNNITITPPAKEAIPAVKRLKVKRDTNKILSDVKYVVVKGINLPIGIPVGLFPKDGSRPVDTTIKTIIIRKSNNSDSVTYIINGEKVNKAEYLKIAPKDIQTINIVDGDLKALPGTVSRIRINGNESEFGPTHPRSVTFIKRTNGDTTKHVITENSYVYVTGDPVNITAKDGTKITTSKFEFTTNDKPATASFNGALIMIDGKEASEKDMKKIPVSEIENVSINKSKEMLDKYGDKAKNGVIFISTKKPK
jgi:bla regulator protein BlaR1